MNFSRAELMALVFARALRDGEVVVTGTNAVLPTAAYCAAQVLGKPRIAALIGASGTLDPSCASVPASGGDQDFVPGRACLGLAGGVADQLRGLIDVIFLGGLQLDAHGRCNLAVIGPYERPLLRGPGSIGLSMVATVRRTFMFFTSHDARVFVPQVDFVSGETLRRGSADGLLVVTPLGVLGSAAGSTQVVLKSVHPGVSFEDIQERTGFPLAPGRAITTAAPTAAELTALRSSEAGRRLASLPLA